MCVALRNFRATSKLAIQVRVGNPGGQQGPSARPAGPGQQVAALSRQRALRYSVSAQDTFQLVENNSRQSSTASPPKSASKGWRCIRTTEEERASVRRCMASLDQKRIEESEDGKQNFRLGRLRDAMTILMLKRCC